MKPGDFVKNKNTGDELLRVKRISKSVATVERINEPKIKHTIGEGYPVYVCSIKNLIPL